MAAWRLHEIQQLNGRAKRIRLAAKLQVMTESWTDRWTEIWNQVAAVPYIVYVSELDRVLMLVSCGNPHQSVILASDDHGATWSEPWYVHADETGKGDTGLGVGFVYVGGGRALLRTSRYWLHGDNEGWQYMRWSSDDFGETWSEGSPVPISGGWAWDPPLVDRDPTTGKATRLWETMHVGGGIYPGQSDTHPRPWSQGYLHWSTDEGRTWCEPVKVPQWAGFNEIALIRAQNGDLVAACRTDVPEERAEPRLDHYAGLAVSISQDDGCTWTNMQQLYAWGRHHPSMVCLPEGDIVMTYVARKGYLETSEGYPQFGVEAVSSHDNGRTWDLDHRYILAHWAGNMTVDDKGWSWCRSSQQTSSVLLPDGSVLTAYGTGYRASVPQHDPQRFNPRDVGLINWRVNNEGLNDDKSIASAPLDSDLRNLFDCRAGTGSGV